MPCVGDIRRERKLTQQAVAAAAGIHLKQLQKLEYGQSVPRLNTARAIARALGSTVDECFPEEAFVA